MPEKTTKVLVAEMFTLIKQDIKPKVDIMHTRLFIERNGGDPPMEQQIESNTDRIERIEKSSYIKGSRTFEIVKGFIISIFTLVSAIIIAILTGKITW